MTKEEKKLEQNKIMLDALRTDSVNVWDKLNKHLSKGFNIFDMLKINELEIRHSNVLAWLFDLNENSAIASIFFNEFFACIRTSYPDFFNKFTNYAVVREFHVLSGLKKNYIDLLLISDATRQLIVIENKIRSKQGFEQLERYVKAIDKQYTNYDKIYIYLTPTDEIISEKAWHRFSYRQVLDGLNKLLNSKIMVGRIEDTVKQYYEIIEPLVNGGVKKQCLEVLKTHHDAVVLIEKYIKKEKINTHLACICQDIIENHENEVRVLIEYLDNSITREDFYESKKNGSTALAQAFELQMAKWFGESVEVRYIPAYLAYKAKGNRIFLNLEIWSSFIRVNLPAFWPDDSSSIDEKLKPRKEKSDEFAFRIEKEEYLYNQDTIDLIRAAYDNVMSK